MAKLTLANVSNILGNPTSASNTINANNVKVQTALENTLSRDGTSPNQMTADIDMNNNDILNVKTLDVDQLTVGGDIIIPGDTAVLPAFVITKPIYDPQGVNGDIFDLNNWGIFEALVDLQAATVRTGVTSVYLKERESGFGGGGYWSYEVTEPNVPTLAKTQDASGRWWKLEPGSNGLYNPQSLGAKGSFCIEPETQAVLHEMDTRPTKTLLRAMDELIVRIKSFDGLWGKLAHLHVGGASNNASDFLIDWKNPSSGFGSFSGANLTYLANRGPKGAATAADINLGYAPNSFGSQNDMHIGVWNEGGTTTSNLVSSAGGAGIGFGLSPGSTGPVLVARVNNSTVVSASVARRDGYSVASRSTSTNLDLYKDGAFLSSPASTSIAPHAFNIRLFADTQDDRVLIFHVGTALTAQDTKRLHRAFRDFIKVAQSAAAGGPAIVAGSEIDAVPYDAQPAMQAAIDLGSVFVPPPVKGDHYWLGDQIASPSNRSFVCAGWDVKFKKMASAPAEAEMFTNADHVMGNENIKVLNGWWDGNRLYRQPPIMVGRDGASGICLFRVRNFTIEGNYCKSNALHGINGRSTDEDLSGELNWKDGLPGSTADQNSYDGIIRNNWSTDNNDDGITTHWIKRVLIEGNHCWGMTGIHSIGSGGIECDDGTQYPTIIGNHVWECDGGYGIAVKGHEGAPAARRAIVTGNMVETCSGGIAVSHVSGVEKNGELQIVSNNTLRDIQYRGIWFEKVVGFVCQGNIVYKVCLAADADDHGGIRLTGGCNGGVISANVVDDTGYAKFAIDNTSVATDLVITGNMIRNTRGGIKCLQPDTTITGNHMRQGTPTGGAVAAPSYGITFNATSENCIATGNNIMGFTDAIYETTKPVSCIVANNIAIDA